MKDNILADIIATSVMKGILQTTFCLGPMDITQMTGPVVRPGYKDRVWHITVAGADFVAKLINTATDPIAVLEYTVEHGCRASTHTLRTAPALVHYLLT